MSTSGTYDFNPSAADMVTSAYGRCGVRRVQLTTDHMVDARLEMNYLLSEWSNKQVNLWTVDLVEVPLIAGQAVYSVDPSTVMVLDAYISTGADQSRQDRTIAPVSRTEYASFTNKNTQGFPSVFWFDRTISPTITLWVVPGQDSTYTLRYYRCRQVQDANLPSGQNAEIPYRWIDAFVTGLAARLAALYKPEFVDRLTASADRAWATAATQDVENVDLAIVPSIGVYRN